MIPENKSVLLTVLEKVLQKYKDNHELMSSVKYNQPLQMVALDHNPNYLCDGYYVIQAEEYNGGFKVGRVEVLKPNNRIRSSYYNAYSQAIVTLNCTEEDIEQPSQYPHPYGPFYHFRARYDEFLKERRTIKWKHCYSKLLLTSWTFKLVNIANTGYYAPIIQIHSSTQNGQITNFTGPVSSILYEKVVKRHMEDFRLKDLRKMYAVESEFAKKGKNSDSIKEEEWQEPQIKEKKNKEISICYYLNTAIKDNQVTQALTPHVQFDNQGKLIKTAKNIPANYISMSDVQGICCPIRPLEQNFEQSGRKDSRINFEKAFGILEQNRQAHQQSQMQAENSNYGSLESDSEPAMDAQVDQNYVQSPNASEQSSSNSDDDDPLAALYRKQLDQQKQIKRNQEELIKKTKQWKRQREQQNHNQQQQQWSSSPIESL